MAGRSTPRAAAKVAATACGTWKPRPDVMLAQDIGMPAIVEVEG